MLARQITYFGKDLILICDGNCKKAFGINGRPEQRFDDEDDFAWLPDGEVGDAPDNPGTYEGGQGKPILPGEHLNKWCARECERSAKVEPGKEFQLRDFSNPVFNQPGKHTGGNSK
jgi:hypothetical protein